MEIWEHLWQFLGAMQLSETGFGRATIMVRAEKRQVCGGCVKGQVCKGRKGSTAGGAREGAG